MRLEEFVGSLDVNASTEAAVNVDMDNIEKLASCLEAYATEDTLIDELAKLAVVADLLEARRGQSNS